MEIVNERLDERPQVKRPPLQLDADFGLEIRAFFEYLANQPFELLHVAMQGFQHLGCSSAGVSRRQCQFQNPRRQGNGIQGSSEIVGHKGQILFAAVLHIQRSLCRIGLHGRSDRAVQDAVDNVESLPLQTQTVVVGQIVETVAQDVVLRHDLFNIKPVLDTLSAMSGRATFADRFGDRLVRP